MDFWAAVYRTIALKAQKKEKVSDELLLRGRILDKQSSVGGDVYVPDPMSNDLLDVLVRFHPDLILEEGVMQPTAIEVMDKDPGLGYATVTFSTMLSRRRFCVVRLYTGLTTAILKRSIGGPGYDTPSMFCGRT